MIVDSDRVDVLHEGMATWKMTKYVTKSGKCPLDKWLTSLTPKDCIRFRTEVEALERVATIPPRKIQKYTGTEVFEFRVKGDNKQLRPFGVICPGSEFMFLSGGIEKDSKIPKADIDRAEHLRKEFENGAGSVKSCF